jgi:hypothetical protein
MEVAMREQWQYYHPDFARNSAYGQSVDVPNFARNLSVSHFGFLPQEVPAGRKALKEWL